MDNTQAHNALKNRILLELGNRPDVLIWNNPTGMFIPYGRSGSPVRVGMPGQADILAVLAPSGRTVGIEVKTGAGVQNKAQKAWQAALEARGGLYIVARSIDDVLRSLFYAV